MKRFFAILTFMLLSAMIFCPALADEPITEYQSDFFTFSFGGDAFEDRGGMMGKGVFYARANSNPLNGSFIVEERGLNIDTETLTDVQRTVWYDLALKEFIADDEESANMEAIEVEGKEARVFSYTLSAQNMSFPAAACVAMRGSRMLILSYFMGPSGSSEEAREKVLAAAGTIRYLGK